MAIETEMIKLEAQQFMTNRQLYSMNPMEDKRIIKIDFEQRDCCIEKKMKEHNDIVPILERIIKHLQGYYKIIDQGYDKPYLDNRISKYETILTKLKSHAELELEPKPEPSVLKEDTKVKDSKPKKEPKVKKDPKDKKEAKEPKKSESKPKKKISATMKRLVWNTNIGEEIGKTKCLCCKSTDITQMSFHCGHVIAEMNGGELIVSNLKPICQNCNSSMGTKNMNEFMETFK
jgi:5-methylcytosine-specific restriction endonuclease McrA